MDFAIHEAFEVEREMRRATSGDPPIVDKRAVLTLQVYGVRFFRRLVSLVQRKEIWNTTYGCDIKSKTPLWPADSYVENRRYAATAS